jgi:pyruvate ferredoxin oxidoreductase alpha subunit
MKKSKKENRKVIEASVAIAEAVRVCNPGVIPIYPITPQTHMVEHLAKLSSDGKIKAGIIHAESEHSAIAAAVGSEAAGVRTFTATSSQGLALMNEILFIVSGMRLPVVMAVANRALSAPINIWNDHSDTMAERDSGWLQVYVESAQEAHDAIFQMYKVCEDKKVLLPGMVCLDGFTLSHVYEPVELINDASKFLPKYSPLYKLDSENPMTFGPIGYPSVYTEFKKQQQEAMMNALPLIKKVHDEFRKKFGRGYGDGLTEEYKTKDAEKILVCMGTMTGTAREVVDEMRGHGKRVGLLKIRCFRPFPKEEINKSCRNAKEIIVIDRAVSFGNAGPVFVEVRDALFNSGVEVSGLIAGLGGRDVTKEDLKNAFKKKSGWLQ